VNCVTGEDDLLELHISSTGVPDATVELTCEAGCWKIKLYEYASRSIPVTLPQSWDVSELPKTLYVEGYDTSSVVRDVELKATYTHNSGKCEDVVKLTVVKPDLAIYNGGSDLDNGEEDPGCHQGGVVPEDDEEAVGAYVLVNWDDDDADGSMNVDGTWERDPVPDLTETYVRHEDNLSKLLPTLDPVPVLGTVELEVVGGVGKVKLWSTCWKQTELQAGSAVKTWDLSDAAQRAEFQQFGLDGIWLEGIEASDAERDVELDLRYVAPTGQTTCSDTVSATVVMINLANAVHREGTLIGVSARGHAALVWRFEGQLTKDNLNDDDKFLIIEMSGPTDDNTLTSMTQSPGEDAWGCFTNPQITLVERLKILNTAKTLVAWAGNITWTGFKALEPVQWDGRLDSIRYLRCDGLVEVCYEINEIEVWG